MLERAAVAAKRMPQLKTMEIWNGRKGLAALFKYQVCRKTRQAGISWKGTWTFHMEASVILAWRAAVPHEDDDWRVDWVQEQLLDEALIKSHADAIHYLKLSGQVIRPVSLRQIQIEQKALESAPTV